MITLRRALKHSIDKRETRAERLKIPLEKYSRTSHNSQKQEPKLLLTAQEKLKQKKEMAKKGLKGFKKDIGKIS